MRVNELNRLDEHAGRTAAGIVDPAPVGFEHLDQQRDDAARGVELTAFLAFGACELRQEILIHATEHVLGSCVLVAHPDVADEVDQSAEPLLVKCRAGVLFG